MFTRRLWAYLLILICGFNAIGVSGAAYLSEKGEVTAAVFSLAQPDQQGTQAIENAVSTVITSHDHSSTDEHGDCGTQHQNCHTCHLGHCQFLVTAASGFVGPDPIRSILNRTSASYLSIDLSGPRKPPRA